MSRAFLIKKNNTAGEYGKSIMIDTGTPVLLCELTELGVCILTMNRPAGRNSIGDDMTPFIRHMLHILKDDDRVRCLVITGAGGAFQTYAATITDSLGGGTQTLTGTLASTEITSFGLSYSLADSSAAMTTASDAFLTIDNAVFSASIPEPSVSLLSMLGAGLLVLRRRR
mgnify:CR=1 FL=1